MRYLLFAAAMLTVSSASAYGASKRSDNAIQQMMRCRQVPDEKERLACYDKEAGALATNVEKGDVMVVDRAQAEQDARDRFGLPPRGEELFKGQTPVKIVTGAIASASEDAYGQYSIVLVDGSHWQQVDTYPLAGQPRSGTTVKITRAALGTFKMSVGGQAAIRVKRTG